MPRKHHRRLYTKPPSTPPVTFASPSSLRSASATSASQTPSVNELLNHLRLSQASSIPPQAAHRRGQPRSHHPSVATFLGADPTPIPLRPRSRIPLGVRATPPRGAFAGPPPPRSWARAVTTAAGAAITAYPTLDEYQAETRPNLDVRRLPELMRVGERSLMHYALLALARNWEWVVVYERYYLRCLRPGLKALLGAYVGAYGGGMGKDSLNVLYPLQGTPREVENRKQKLDSVGGESGAHNRVEEESIENSSGGNTNELLDTWEASSDSADMADPYGLTSVTHLDLSHSLGKLQPDPLTIRSLERFLFSGNLLPFPDLHPFGAARIDSPAPRLHLPSLTHLSLAYPTRSLPPSPLWTTSATHSIPYVLSFIPTLTHLSLAGWPPPESPGVHTVQMTVMRLSRGTYCLKWLDLSDWHITVMEKVFMGLNNEGEMDCVWGGWWRGVGEVVWRRSNYVGKVEVGGLRDEAWVKWEREVVRMRRTTRGGGKRLKVIVYEDEHEGE